MTILGRPGVQVQDNEGSIQTPTEHDGQAASKQQQQEQSVVVTSIVAGQGLGAAALGQQ